MNDLLYLSHEARRQTGAIKETVKQACHAVYPEPNVCFRVEAGPSHLPEQPQRMRITVFQIASGGSRQPLCVIEIDRRKTKVGSYHYTKATAHFLELSQQAGNARLVGQLLHHCPFLPRMQVTLGYELR